MTTGRRRLTGRGALTGVVLAGAGSLLAAGLASAAPREAGAAAATAAGVAATLDRYCTTCHNARVVAGRGAVPSMLVSQLREIGLAFDTLDLADLAGHTDVWERVVRKLDARTMRPVGRPRPD